MKIASCALASALFVCASAASGQLSPAPTSVVVAPATNMAVLRVGTEVPLKTSEDLTTKGKKIKLGHRVKMEVAEAIMMNGVVVVPAGSPVVGEITEVRNKGMWGKSGYLAGRALYTTVNGRQIRLTGQFDDKGTAGGVGAVATSVILVPVAGFFMTGTSAQIPAGTPVKGFVDEDVQLAMPATGPAPLTIAPMPAPVMVSAPASPAPTMPTMQPAVVKAATPAR